MSDLNEWISRETLADFAGNTIYQRGISYFQQGAVSRLTDMGDKVTARVSGTAPYHVELSTTEEEFEYDCTCPHAAEGNFCKHCVAVGLAFLDARERGFGPGVSGDAVWEGIRHYLESQPSDILVDWVLEAAQRDNRLYRKLAQAQRNNPTGYTGRASLREIGNSVI